MTHQIAPYGLRMPNALKTRVQAIANRERRSMNNLIVRVLENAVEADEKMASEPTA